MRVVVAMVLASSMFVSNAFAGVDSGPLAPGKPAGVKQADIEAGGVLLVLGVLGLAAGIALLASGTQGNGSAAATTPTTPTTPTTSAATTTTT
jgi:hypothetical protein